MHSRTRPVRRAVLGEQEWLAAQIAQGAQELMARFLLGFYQATQRGDFATVDPLPGRLLGREPRTVRNLLTQPAA
ncbi:hypothetical protein ACH4OY_22115 [Micromonospora rubida]|uniref:Uncharacterized protein n=1 Tax=Micromonospora rubida TaxID=2697657 RepID=A0ABW7SNV5_9ACTN